MVGISRLVMSVFTVTTVGIISKAFLNSGLCSIKVSGLQTLLAALDNPNRRSQGVITVSNHISTLDDPLVWGFLPCRYYLNSRTTRWALGASDIIFTNPLATIPLLVLSILLTYIPFSVLSASVFSTFFALGQTLETFRGQGIYQAAVDTAIQKVNQADWVHLYSEGKVNQSNTYPRDDEGRAHLPRFKWGVGRILMEAKISPIVIPMWITGFDQLMPEGRPFPYKYLPRVGTRLTVTFGEPVSPDKFRKALVVNETLETSDVSPHIEQLINRKADQGGASSINSDARHAHVIRQRLTAIIQNEVEALGRSVSGQLLAD